MVMWCWREFVFSLMLVQNAGGVLTLSGQALSGVAITSGSVSLAGSLVLDVSGIDVYDGMSFTLINATSITGQWQSVVAQSTSECTSYDVSVSYTQQFAIATVHQVSLCGSIVSTIQVAAMFL